MEASSSSVPTGCSGCRPETAAVPAIPTRTRENLNTLLGKLLRIDPRRERSDSYSVPPDNPFVGLPGRDEIWSRGLRNPWRFSFDSNRIAIADVGAASWEEVNYETITTSRGANFGWDNYEGTHLFEGPELTEHELPIHEYSSATGGPTARSSGATSRVIRALPDLLGRYLYADFCAGELRSLIPRLSGALDDAPLGLTVDRPTSFGVGPGRRLYVASIAGPVYRLVPGPPPHRRRPLVRTGPPRVPFRRSIESPRGEPRHATQSSSP